MKLIEFERCEPSGKGHSCLCEVALEIKGGGVSGV